MNTFQVVLATDAIKTFLLFLYDEINWASNETVIGFTTGENMQFGLPEFMSAEDILNLPKTSNVGKPGVYAFRVDIFGQFKSLDELLFH